MTPGGGGGPPAPLTTDIILGQIEAAVLVTDRLGHLRYANPYAAALFGLPDGVGRLAGLSVLSLMCEEDDPGGAIRQVLAGGAWEGALTSLPPYGSRAAIQAQAVPLRDSAGAIEGIVVIARRAAPLTLPSSVTVRAISSITPGTPHSSSSRCSATPSRA